MDKIESLVTIKIWGVKIDDDFNIEIPPPLYDGQVKNIKCFTILGVSSEIFITATILGNNINHNAIIAEKLVDDMYNLFCLFGAGVYVKDWTISTGKDYLNGKASIFQPAFIISGEEVNKQVAKIISKSANSDMAHFFYNLKESHGEEDIHRFRSLFSIFDRLSEKKLNKATGIDYSKMKQGYKDEIKKLYTGYEYFQRYIDRVTDLENAELKSNSINYSKKLKEARNKLQNSDFINDEVAEMILKCIQVVRNRLNHGSFEDVTNEVINAAYELLLPYVQKLIKENDIL